MDNAAFLLFGCSPIPHKDLLSRANFHGQGDQRTMRVHLQCGGVFCHRLAVAELRNHLDLHSQEDALRAAIVNGGRGTLGRRHARHDFIQYQPGVRRKPLFAKETSRPFLGGPHSARQYSGHASAKTAPRDPYPNGKMTVRRCLEEICRKHQRSMKRPWPCCIRSRGPKNFASPNSLRESAFRYSSPCAGSDCFSLSS
jgi:hypothetical protein